MNKDFALFKRLEAASEERVPSNSIAVLRLDGSNFSKYTKQFEAPFSVPFELAMDAAGQGVIANVLPNHLLTYVASDEISVIFSTATVQCPYGGRVSKLLSLSASHATAAFMKAIGDAKGVPAFDARLITFTDSSLIREYVTWRRLDVRKNATSMAAGHLHSHKSLMGVSTAERGELLVGTAFEKIPDGTFNGRFLTKATSETASRELAEDLSREAKNLHDAKLVELGS